MDDREGTDHEEGRVQERKRDLHSRSTVFPEHVMVRFHVEPLSSTSRRFLALRPHLMRRQTSATDINLSGQQSGPSGIPQSALPTAKRRAEQMPPATQPPYSRMRMSVAGGGPGPSRPQQNAGLAPPGAAQFAPRASMMPGGGAPQTVRKDASQMGRTPLKARYVHVPL